MSSYTTPQFRILVIISFISSYSIWRYYAKNYVSIIKPVIWNTQECEGEEQPLKRVAIIGAGSAGASTAYYLERLRPRCQALNITVYEKSNYVGGRSTTVNVYDEPSESVELGASIFVQLNKNLVSAASELGLVIKRPYRRDQKTLSKLGIWDGLKFVFIQDDNSYSWWNSAKLLWQYGLAPIRTRNLMKKSIGKFLKMYQKPYFPFRSLSKVALDLDLTPLTSTVAIELLRQNSILPPFSTDVIQASTRVNYAQNLAQLHGLEAMVCMAIDGAMAIEGGNWHIFDGMITRSRASLALNTGVCEITRQEDGLFQVRSISSHGLLNQEITLTDTFDTIVIASPFSGANITFLPKLEHEPDDVPYVSLHVTLFASPHRMSSKMFGSSSPIPDIVLTTVSQDDAGNISDPGFFSISTLRTIMEPPLDIPGPQYLYKVFSAQPLRAAFFSQLLGFHHSGNELAAISKDDISWLYEKLWHSYPYLYPRETFAELSLAKNVWYTSGIESFISTMETSSLMGSNIARLIIDDWTSELGDYWQEL